MPRSIPFSVSGYRIEKSIGEGIAGTVYQARATQPHINPSETPCSAIKVIPRSSIRDPVRREVAIHIRLRHQNIIRLYHVAPTTQSTQTHNSHRPHSHQFTSPSLAPPPAPAALALVMEHASAGDMFQEVLAAGCLPPRLVKSRLRHITSALQYLHQNRIVHLDVKLENVVITNASVAKLIDFGCSYDLHSNHDFSQVSLPGGTLHYLPPEMINCPNTTPSPACDAWSLGVLAYTALVGNYPFAATASDHPSQDDDNVLQHRILHSPPHNIPSSIRIPPDLKRVVFGLLEKDPNKRMTIADVIAELNRPNDFSRRRNSTETHVSRLQTMCDCHNERPRSPVATAEAEFAFCECNTEQTVEEALQVVASLQRSRHRASRDVHKYFVDTDSMTAPKPRHSVSRVTGEERGNCLASLEMRN